MIALMAVKTGHAIHPRVLDGIARQSTPLHLVVSPCAPVHNERTRECSINRSRNELQRIASGIELGGMVLLIDSDVCLVDDDTVALMAEYMTNDVGCVAVQTKPDLDNHVVTACALIRSSVYLDLDFSSTPSICQCNIIATKCKSVYLPDCNAFEIPKL